MYKTPNSSNFLLHFDRSRFNSKFEDSLLILADRIAEVGVVEKDEFNKILDRVIKEYLIDGPLEQKTVDNYRTEMIRLYGLVYFQDGMAYPGKRLLELSNDQDIPKFFKSLCKRFQYPGGFSSRHTIALQVKNGIKFKPASYVLKLLWDGANILRNKFLVSANEIAHFVFNDKRVTEHGDKQNVVLRRILEKRRQREQIDSTNDVIRYARDFLNFMVQANLLHKVGKLYAINLSEINAVKSIMKDKTYFSEYSKIIDEDGQWEKEEFNKAQEDWEEWYSSTEEEEALTTSIVAMMPDDESTMPDGWQKIKDILQQKDSSVRRKFKKELGDEGERIALEFEKKHIKEKWPTQITNVKSVASLGTLGYDIISLHEEENELKKKYIEVKTTKKTYLTDLAIPFKISRNEWNVAKQMAGDYFIYRVIITKDGVRIFSIQDPYKKGSENLLRAAPVEYDITNYENAGGYVL